MRCDSSGAIFAVISFCFGGVGDAPHDAVAIAELDSRNGSLRRMFELPQFRLGPMVCWQWLGPLLSVVEPIGVNGTMHLFAFNFGAEAEETTGETLTCYEGWRLAVSDQACAPPSSIAAHPDVRAMPGSVSTDTQGSRTIFHCSSEGLVEQLASNGRPDAPLSGLWRILGLHNGESYRYHLRMVQHGKHISGGGYSLGLNGTVAPGVDGGLQVHFRQFDPESECGDACDCHATFDASGLRGTWTNTEGHSGSFTGTKVSDALSGCRPLRLCGPASEEVVFPHVQEFAASGHRFAVLLEGRRGVVLCEWPQPFVFGQ